MEHLDDMELVRRYAETGCEEAFATIVARYVDMVHSAALRQVRDAHLAADVTQAVFLLLAKKAPSLTKETLLVGWLHRATRFTASDTLRASHRRRLRETQAMEDMSTHPDDRPWQEVERNLDEALEGLPEQDRQALLLRFFRKLSLREVGDELGITEDAAQKRVARAVDRLREAFAHQGATASASVLAGILGAHAVEAAPLALTATIVSAATATAAGLTGPTLSMTAMKLMLSTKVKTTMAALALAALATSTVIQHNKADRLSQVNHTLRGEVQDLQSSLLASQAASTPELISEQALAKLRHQAAEVHQLRGEVAVLRRMQRELAAQAQTKAATATTDERGSLGDSAGLDPMERMKLAGKLLSQGRPADALEHYLWCFDEGMKESPAFAGVRLSFLLTKIADLGNAYPPAREALQTRRGKLEAGWQSGPSQAYKILELTTLNEHLGEPERNLALADQLEPSHPARNSIYKGLAEQLIDEQRYAELVKIAEPEKVYGKQLALLKMTQQRLEGSPLAASSQESLQRSLIRLGAVGVEALAGAGYTERAVALAQEVFIVDEAPETRRWLIERALQAGNGEVAAALENDTTPLR